MTRGRKSTRARRSRGKQENKGPVIKGKAPDDFVLVEKFMGHEVYVAEREDITSLDKLKQKILDAIKEKDVVEIRLEGALGRDSLHIKTKTENRNETRIKSHIIKVESLPDEFFEDMKEIAEREPNVREARYGRMCVFCSLTIRMN